MWGLLHRIECSKEITVQWSNVNGPKHAKKLLRCTECEEHFPFNFVVPIFLCRNSADSTCQPTILHARCTSVILKFGIIIRVQSIERSWISFSYIAFAAFYFTLVCCSS